MGTAFKLKKIQGNYYPVPFLVWSFDNAKSVNLTYNHLFI